MSLNFIQLCFPLANQQMSTSNLWVFGFKSNEEKLATRQQLNKIKLPPSPAVSLF